MRVAVTGAAGMLGRDVVSAAQARGFDVVALGRDRFDITAADVEQQRQLGELGVDAVINCAAYTAVDAAETDDEAADRVNAYGPGQLATATAALGIPVVHVSTDYVFSGVRPCSEDGEGRAWRTDDEPAPVSAYGRSKLTGERLVAAGNPQHAIVRTSWLAGASGPNFVATMLQLAARQAGGSGPRPLKVVDDQWGRFTFTRDLAGALLDLLVAQAWGVHHRSNAGPAHTWHDLAAETFRTAGLDVDLAGCATQEFPRPAPRPAWSVLDLGGAHMPDWRDAVVRLVDELRQQAR